MEPKLQGALAYEAALGPRRIAAGGIPDVGEQRSFPDPKATLEMKGHHVTELASYEVNVRVPKGAVKAAEPPEARGGALSGSRRTCRRTPRCWRLPSRLRSAISSSGELREVARLKGIADKLAKPVADQLKKAFK